jgi:hypothetical protein
MDVWYNDHGYTNIVELAEDQASYLRTDDPLASGDDVEWGR